MAVFGGPGGAVVGGPPICPSLGGAGVAKGGFSSGISMKDPAFFVSVDGPSTAPALIPGVALGWVTGGPARLPLGGSSGAGSGGREAAAASAAASTNSLRDLGPGRGASDSRGPMRSGRQRWRETREATDEGFAGQECFLLFGGLGQHWWLLHLFFGLLARSGETKGVHFKCDLPKSSNSTPPCQQHAALTALRFAACWFA